VGAREDILRIGLKLAEGFPPVEPLLLLLGQAALRLGRYGAARAALIELRQFPSSLVTVMGWEIAHANHHQDHGEARWCARFAAAAIMQRRATPPHPDWALALVRAVLQQHGEVELLARMESALAEESASSPAAAVPGPEVIRR
jgi:hypothetical protein